MAVRKQKVLIQRLAPARPQRAQPDERSVGIVQFGVAPLGLDLTVLKCAGAFCTDRRTNNVGVRVLGPARFRIIGKVRCRRRAGQRQQSRSERPPHRGYFSVRTAASVLATCSLKSRSPWTIAILPFS